MDTVTLGRTGLEVSVMGLGCGGHSKLGIQKGKSEQNAILVIQQAIELGVTLIDTAEAYGTEYLVGRALKEKRTKLVLATKFSPRIDGKLKTAAQIRESLETSLRHLQSDWVDLYQVHGVRSSDYQHVAEYFSPILQQLQQEGKIRFIGITEAFGKDVSHRMLTQAVQDELWDTIMVGFNMMNQSATKRILPEAEKKNIGVLAMFAVRRALSDMDLARERIRELIGKGELSPQNIDPQEALGFLLKDGQCASLSEAAYRFCRHEPGIDCVLSGTSSLTHLEENAKAIQMPALPSSMLDSLRAQFGHLECVSGD